jgi:ankyrin repeat protein
MKADIYSEDYLGRNPLMCAASEGNELAAKLILDYSKMSR